MVIPVTLPFSQITRVTIFVSEKRSPCCPYYADVGLRQLITLLRNGKSITVNLLIDQNIILYLLQKILLAAHIFAGTIFAGTNFLGTYFRD